MGEGSQQQQELLFRGSAPFGVPNAMQHLRGQPPAAPFTAHSYWEACARGRAPSKSKRLLLSPPTAAETTNARRLAAIKRACLLN